MSTGPQPQRPIAEFTTLASGELDGFLAEVPHPVLLIGPGAKLGKLDEITVGTQAEERTCEFDAQPSAVQTVVVPLAKRAGTSVAGIIWVGRAVSCDVILAYKAVSKVHAVIAQDSSGRLTLSDVGSKNGTWVNGNRLQTGQPVELKDQDSIKFGDVEARLLEPESLYLYLQTDARG